jgi:tyrosyl-tRNA synthetase
MNQRPFARLRIADSSTIEARFDKRPQPGTVAYMGFGLTADSLHVGHLTPIMMLRWFQRTHTV